MRRISIVMSMVCTVAWAGPGALAATASPATREHATHLKLGASTLATLAPIRAPRVRLWGLARRTRPILARDPSPHVESGSVAASGANAAGTDHGRVFSTANSTFGVMLRFEDHASSPEMLVRKRADGSVLVKNARLVAGENRRVWRVFTRLTGPASLPSQDLPSGSVVVERLARYGHPAVCAYAVTPNGAVVRLTPASAHQLIADRER